MLNPEGRLPGRNQQESLKRHTEIPRLELRNYAGYYYDVDGTIYENGRISQELIDQLADLTIYAYYQGKRTGPISGSSKNNLDKKFLNALVATIARRNIHAVSALEVFSSGGFVHHRYTVNQKHGQAHIQAIYTDTFCANVSMPPEAVADIRKKATEIFAEPSLFSNGSSIIGMADTYALAWDDEYQEYIRSVRENNPGKEIDPDPDESFAQKRLTEISHRIPIPITEIQDPQKKRTIGLEIIVLGRYDFFEEDFFRKVISEETKRYTDSYKQDAHTPPHEKIELRLPTWEEVVEWSKPQMETAREIVQRLAEGRQNHTQTLRNIFIQRLQQSLGAGYQVIEAGKNTVIVSLAGSGKVHAIEYILEVNALQYRRNKILYFGDGFAGMANDRPVAQYFPHQVDCFNVGILQSDIATVLNVGTPSVNGPESTMQLLRNTR